MTEHYDRFDPAKNYDRHLFRPDRILQSAEFNELQSAEHQRLKGIADVLLKDGDIIRDAGIVIDLPTGNVTLEGGAIYLDGAVRGIAPAQLTISMEGTVTIGAFMLSEVITAQEDPALLNPAAGTRGYNEPGADRLRVVPTWGLEGSRSDAEFFPVYTVVDGNVRQKTAPPNLDVVAQAIASYDRDSTEGCYAIAGLDVELLGSNSTDQQTYLVAAGRARVNGHAVELSTSRRVTYDAAPDTRLISSEPHLITTDGLQRINVNRPAIAELVTLQVTRETTVDITHGAYVGAVDALPFASVISISEVKQGATTYDQGADWTLVGGSIDWSPSGAEPATGSTYSVTLRYIDTPAPIAPDERGFGIEGAVVNSLALVTYKCKLPRLDRLCLDDGGGMVWIRGTSSISNPVAPPVPGNLLPIATINQTWLAATRAIAADGPRMMPMRQLSRLQQQLDYITNLVAEQRLLSDANVRDQGIRRGVFVDPFTSDAMRDLGIEQTAAIVDGELCLPLINVRPLNADSADHVRCRSVRQVEVAQLSRTGSMKINPYGAQLPMPAQASLVPAVDRWTETATLSASPITERIQSSLAANPWYASTGKEISTTVTKSTTSTEAIWTLREIDVAFTLRGFGAGERLVLVNFDGIDVTPQPFRVANAQGVVTGTFRIPAGVRSGRKRVLFTGEGATFGEAEFYGEGTREITKKQDVTTIEPEYVLSYYSAGSGGQQSQLSWPPGWAPSDFASIEEWFTKAKIFEKLNPGTCIIDPLAQTFRVSRICQLESAHLMLTKRGAAGRPIMVQVRTTSNGVPTSQVLAEAHHTPAAVGQFEAVFNAAPLLFPGIEYALVVLTDDLSHEVAIATLGEYDSTAGAWVSGQSYEIGVLLSSANAQTWTAHQDRDLWFRLNIARYTEGERERWHNLGFVQFEGVTDVKFLSGAFSPTPGAGVEYLLNLPGDIDMQVADNQSLQFASPVTGDVSVYSIIRATEFVSGVVNGPTTLVVGELATSGTYYTRAISAGANCRLRVIYDAVLPPGSGVVAEYQLDGGAWQPCAGATAAPAANGALELTSVTPGITAANVRVRLTLTGTPAARPRLRDLRVIVME